MKPSFAKREPEARSLVTPQRSLARTERVEVIAERRQPVEATVKALTRRIDLLRLWSGQVHELGIR